MSNDYNIPCTRTSWEVKWHVVRYFFLVHHFHTSIHRNFRFYCIDTNQFHLIDGTEYIYTFEIPVDEKFQFQGRSNKKHCEFTQHYSELVYFRSFFFSLCFSVVPNENSLARVNYVSVMFVNSHQSNVNLFLCRSVSLIYPLRFCVNE